MTAKGRKRESGDSRVLRRYLNEIREFPLLTREEEQELGKRIAKGDQAALRKLVQSNLRFVVSFAKRFRGMGLSFQDIINEGNIGLIEAAKRFDPDKGVKFITYAVWWIRQSIMHAISDHGGIFRLPQKQANLLYNIHKTINSMTPVLERKPTPGEVAKHLSLDTESVEMLMRTENADIPLDSGETESQNVQLLDRLEQFMMPPLDQALVRESMAKVLSGLLSNLDEIEKNVIRLRFGFDEKEPMTLKQVGDKLNLSRERIRQIEGKALKKLKKAAKSHRLLEFLN